MGRVAFLVDGFNLYHSLAEAARLTEGRGTKWLDLGSLCEANLHQVGAASNVAAVFYFSALAHHQDPQNQARQSGYITCLGMSGIKCELSRFKKRQSRCLGCGARWNRYVEKETDVALAVKLLELFQQDSCDEAVLITGDTDLSPAIRAARRLFPAKRVFCAFPYLRENDELRALAHKYFTISPQQYRRHQFPDPFPIGSGNFVSKPDGW